MFPSQDDNDSQVEVPKEQEAHTEAMGALETWQGLEQAAAQRLAQAGGALAMIYRMNNVYKTQNTLIICVFLTVQRR